MPRVDIRPVLHTEVQDLVPTERDQGRCHWATYRMLWELLASVVSVRFAVGSCEVEVLRK
jgi:hypothetical protein